MGMHRYACADKEPEVQQDEKDPLQHYCFVVHLFGHASASLVT